MNSLITAQIESIRTLKDGTLKVNLECQEMPNGTEAKLLSLRGKVLKAYLSDEGILPDVMNEIDKTEIREEDAGKSPSQRLRGVFYRIWEQDNKPGIFEDFYRGKMSRLIDHFKDQLI